MKKNTLLLLILLSSCAPLKFKEIEMDVTQEPKGKVKEIISEVSYYHYKVKDSVIRKITISVLYGRDGRVLKQTDFYPKRAVETNYYYSTLKVPDSTVTGYTNSINTTKFKYDSKQNLVEYNWFENNKLVSRKTLEYDKKNNVVKEMFFRPNDMKNNATTKFTYDYKNRIRTSTNLDNEGKNSNFSSKLTYDKKGYIIRMESHYKNSSSNNTIGEISYDDAGNLTKSIHYDEKGDIKSSLTAKNTYDKKGNILVRERFSDGRLFEKCVSRIFYY